MSQNTKHKVHRFVSNDFTLRATAVNATEVIKTMQSLQRTYPIATVAVGRTMIGALLMASQLKEGQQVGILIKGNGSLKSVYAEANFNGQVRGYTPNPQYQPPNYDNGLSTSDAIGRGTLSVTRHQPFQKRPHHGTVEIKTGEVGDDIAHYLHQSHQIRSIVSLGVYLDSFGKVLSAGGIIVEVMPGVEDEIVKKLQKNYKNSQHNLSQDILDGKSINELVDPFFKGIPYTQLDHNFEIEYFCPCTVERVVRALETLGVAELEDMIAKKEKAEVVCQMCGRPYEIDVDSLEQIKEKVRKESLN